MSLNHKDGVVAGITDGIHLDMGSSEYKEYILDKKEINELDQDRILERKSSKL